MDAHVDLHDFENVCMLRHSRFRVNLAGATKEHAQALLGGVATEFGRIGYVAATRARDLLWVAVPHNFFKELRPQFLAKGFKEVGTATTAPAAKPMPDRESHKAATGD
jgi:ATP-dependent exoDNAse (exonuclease V) beta subunit